MHKAPQSPYLSFLEENWILKSRTMKLKKPHIVGISYYKCKYFRRQHKISENLVSLASSPDSNLYFSMDLWCATYSPHSQFFTYSFSGKDKKFRGKEFHYSYEEIKLMANKLFQHTWFDSELGNVFLTSYGKVVLLCKLIA